MLDAPGGVEVTLREKSSARFFFLLNHRDKPQRVALGACAGEELLSGQKAKSSWLLPAYGVAVIAVGNQL